MLLIFRFRFFLRFRFCKYRFFLSFRFCRYRLFFRFRLCKYRLFDLWLLEYGLFFRFLFKLDHRRLIRLKRLFDLRFFRLFGLRLFFLCKVCESLEEVRQLKLRSAYRRLFVFRFFDLRFRLVSNTRFSLKALYKLVKLSDGLSG